MEYREFRAQWLIRRRLLDSARAQFLAEEQARLDSFMEQMTQASGAQTAGAMTDESDARREEQDEEKAKSVFKEERVSTPLSAPSPSLVSLIASGVKTDALLKAEQGRNTPGLSDAMAVASGERASNVSESVQATLRSEESAIENRVRRTWDSPDESVTELGKLTEAGSGRKTWEAPAEGEVKIASSLPKSHPSDSSIQFAMYSDKRKSSEEGKTPSPGMRADAFKTSTPHVGDSLLQNVLYPSTPSESKSGLDAQSANVVTWPSDMNVGGLVVHHPSDSSAQDVLYGSAVEGSFEARMPSSQGHPSDSIAEQLLYSSGTQGGATTEARSLEQRHPSDSSVSGLLYPDTVDTPNSQASGLSQYGHPSDSQVSLSHGDNVAHVIRHSARPTWQHPSDASVHKLLGDINVLGESQQTTRGTPPTSMAQDILYPKPNEQSTPYASFTRGTPSQSIAQDILYPTVEESGQSYGVVRTRGTPPQSVIQDIMYPSGEGTVGRETRVSTRGQEPAVKIKHIMYYVKKEEGEIETKIC